MRGIYYIILCFFKGYKGLLLLLVEVDGNILLFIVFMLFMVFGFSCGKMKGRRFLRYVF